MSICRALIYVYNENILNGINFYKALTSDPSDAEVSHAPTPGEDYGKGVIFYTRNEKIVGILLWNLFGRMPVARQVSSEIWCDISAYRYGILINMHIESCMYTFVEYVSVNIIMWDILYNIITDID